MILKPQDILVVLKLVVMGPRPWTYADLAEELSLSPSQVHTSVQRSLQAGLLQHKQSGISPDFRNLEEFLLHGLRYMCVAERGTLCWGMATARAAPPLKGRLTATKEPPPVWPDPDGEIQGLAFSPLHKSAPDAAHQDAKLYEMLVLIDGMRSTDVREIEMAKQGLMNRLERYGTGH